jgi:hypothetical protein
MERSERPAAIQLGGCLTYFRENKWDTNIRSIGIAKFRDRQQVFEFDGIAMFTCLRSSGTNLARAARCSVAAGSTRLLSWKPGAKISAAVAFSELEARDREKLSLENAGEDGCGKASFLKDAPRGLGLTNGWASPLQFPRKCGG